MPLRHEVWQEGATGTISVLDHQGKRLGSAYELAAKQATTSGGGRLDGVRSGVTVAPSGAASGGIERTRWGSAGVVERPLGMTAIKEVAERKR